MYNVVGSGTVAPKYKLKEAMSIKLWPNNILMSRFSKQPAYSNIYFIYYYNDIHIYIQS